ncbi:MAG: CapA family protein, partial [Solirubrobacterales bacterium]|nr:CapA family protein [Solirubrobacterales bacterium]
IAAERLAELGVNAVTLANNHALDYGPDALLDTLAYLRATGIATVGAGADLETAHTPLILRCGALRIRLVAFSDHPADYAAGPDRPGIAFAELRRDPPDWVLAAIRPGPDTHLTLATPHWGPNMVPEPQPHVRRAAGALLHAGANLVAGHSAHVFHGVAPGVIFDMGDFLDDYIVHRKLRNDLGLLWLIDLDPHGPRAIRALPLALEYCFTRRASPAETDTILRLLQARCTPFGTDPHIHGGMIELNTDRSTEPT